MPWKVLANREHTLTLKALDIACPQGADDLRVSAKRTLGDHRIGRVVPDIEDRREIHADANCGKLSPMHIAAGTRHRDPCISRQLTQVPWWGEDRHAALDRLHITAFVIH